MYPWDGDDCTEILLLEPTVLKLVTGREFPGPLAPFEEELSSIASLGFVTGDKAASISHIKTSPPRPPDATTLL